jgi:hypothetical protein
MNPRTYLTISAIATAFALPASASAATPSASASVRADAHASAQAFEQVTTLTQADRDGDAAAKLRLGLRELRAAARTTARMRRGAHGNRALKRAVHAEGLVGQTADLGALGLVGVVADADVAVDIDMASAIAGLMAIHQQAIDALAATVDVASDAVDALAIQTIAELTGTVTGVVSAIGATLASGDLSLGAATQLNAALGLAMGTVTGSLALLQSLSGVVSPIVQGLVGTAIATVTGALGQAQATLQTLVGTVATLGTGAIASMVLPTLGRLLGAVDLALSSGAHVDVAASAGVGATAG